MLFIGLGLDLDQTALTDLGLGLSPLFSRSIHASASPFAAFGLVSCWMPSVPTYYQSLAPRRAAASLVPHYSHTRPRLALVGV